jgi:hypothetical protein
MPASSTDHAAGRTLSVLSVPKQNSASLGIDDVFARKKWYEMFCDTDRSHAWSAAAVWDAKRLMQIQMANVRAVIAGATKANLRIHIGTVHVNLAAMRVNDVANFPNRGFKYAMG